MKHLKNSLAKAGRLLLSAAALLLAETKLAGQATEPNAGAPTNPPPIAAESPEAISNAPPAQTESQAEVFQRRFDERRNAGAIYRNAVVVRGHDVVLKEGESAEAVVVIGGSAKILGKVRDAVVVIGGDIDVEGEVGEGVVAVMGKIKAGPSAKIYGDVVVVGGRADLAEGAKIHGQLQEVDLGEWGLPKLEWIRNWFVQCVLKFRPLAPQVGWVWGVAAAFLLVYLLVAAVFPGPLLVCAAEMSRRPATTFAMGLLTKLLVPLVLFLLIATVIGIVAVPFVIAALLMGIIVGKAAILELIGSRIGGQFGGSSFQKPILALLLGAVIISLLYMVPLLGLLTYAVLSVWGLGGAVTAAFAGFRKEQPPKSAPPSPASPIPPMEPASAPAFSSTMSGVNPGEFSAAGATTLAAPTTATLPELLEYPKASFWQRMAAAFLDLVIVGILSAIVQGPPWMFLVALAYFSGMWAWKGTTVGGIVLGLKIVRQDGQQLSFVVALVRALAAAFSAMVLFLGILWIAWDTDKQGWHDRIAGTYVLRLPKGTPLV